VPEPVDRLEGVADREQVLAGDRLDELELDGIGVLELVDHDLREALGVPAAQLAVGGEQVAGQELEVLEVERRLAVLLLCIGRRKALEQLLEQITVAPSGLIERRLLDSLARLFVDDSAVAADTETGEVDEPVGPRVALQQLEQLGGGLVVDGARGLAQLLHALGQLRAIAVTLFNVANNIRWLGSGPRCGFYEIMLPDRQPGSSIMPGKVNPVMPEVVTQAAAQVIGNDAAITIGGLQGQLELNVRVPLIARNLLSSGDK